MITLTALLTIAFISLEIANRINGKLIQPHWELMCEDTHLYNDDDTLETLIKSLEKAA